MSTVAKRPEDIGMSAIPLAKRRRVGRPKSSTKESMLATEAGVDVLAQDAATDRHVGRMSLRYANVDIYLDLYRRILLYFVFDCKH